MRTAEQCRRKACEMSDLAETGSAYREHYSWLASEWRRLERETVAIDLVTRNLQAH